jgi:hypothetical protein
MSKAISVRITWGPLTKDAAPASPTGEREPTGKHRRVYLPIGYFNRFYDVNEALIKALPGTHVMPRNLHAPAYLTVFDPPPKKELPIYVEIQEEENETYRGPGALGGQVRQWLRWF